MTAEPATPDTLAVVNICDGKHIVTGGPDGQIWVATFASAVAADHFVRYCVDQQKTFWGLKA
jgi:hypothetical protein